MDDPIVEERLSLFDHRRGKMMGVFSLCVALGLTCVLLAETLPVFQDGTRQALEIDFFVFWGAAKLAASGLPIDALDPERIREAAGIAEGRWLPWAYPPAFLLVLTPLGYLSFSLAWVTFVALSTLAIVLAIRPLTGGRVQLLCAAALAPAFAPAFLMGQTSTLWAAGLVAALVALHSDRPVLAGIFIGLLTFKPQLGLLIPVALIAMGAWRTIFSAAATTALMIIIPTLVFGVAYWPALIDVMALHSDTTRGSIEEITLMVSPYSFLAGLGLPEHVALGVQSGITLLCALIVFLTWRRPSVSFDAKAAVLIIAILLSSPYLWLYEIALLAPAALYMLRAGILGAVPWHILLGVAMWLGLAIGMGLVLQGSDADIHRFYIVPVATIAFATCLIHVRNTPVTS